MLNVLNILLFQSCVNCIFVDLAPGGRIFVKHLGITLGMALLLGIVIPSM